MEEDANDCPGFARPAAASASPSIVSLPPFSPVAAPASSRRLSSQFTPSRHAVQLVPRLAWVSLQGRLVNAEDASSAKTIAGSGGGLSRGEAVAWELFTPIQRFLIVAVIGVAVAESKKNHLISQLNKSVELRDQVLSGMQKKLDDLCEQMHNVRVCEGTKENNDPESPTKDAFGCDKIKFVDCGCWHCDQHQNLFAALMGSSGLKVSKGDEVLQYKMPLMNGEEQEERRLSDLSDWASSVTSSAEIQMNTFSVDQDIFNLKRDCEVKDATIKELRTTLQSTNTAGSKQRIADLEEIIRRKNTMITRLKKDMLILEQKVVNLTRLRRPSASMCNFEHWNPPVMVDNIVYDMDSTTGPSSSSSDSDSSPVNRPEIPVSKVEFQETTIRNLDLASTTEQKSAPAIVSSSSSATSVECDEAILRIASPLKEISPNQKSSRPPSSRQKQFLDGGDIRKTRRRIQTPAKSEGSKKRWV